METERAKMGPYMRVLERLVGYKSLKARYSRVGVFEPIEDEEESEITDTTVYKSPVIERDEKIEELIVEKDVLRKEKETLEKNLPELQEQLTKANSKLQAVEKAFKQKTKQLNQASTITERRLAEAISLEPTYLRDNPHLVTLLAIFQERDDFDIDPDTNIVKPVHEETFLKETIKNVEVLTSKQFEDQPVQVEQCQERLGDIKNQLLESVKQRWIRPDRRNSIGSVVSSNSKRNRDTDDSPDRLSRPRLNSHGQ